MKKSADSRSAAIAYWALLFAQSLIAGYLFWIVIPIFRQLMSRAGETLDIEGKSVGLLTGRRKSGQALK